MAVEKCEFHALHEDTLKRHDYDIRDIKGEVNELKVSQKEVNTKFIIFMESMNKLPEILESMKTAQFELTHEIKGMKEDITEIKKCQSTVKKDLKAVDDKSKIDLIPTLTKSIANNWWKIVIGLAAVIATYNQVIALLSK